MLKIRLQRVGRKHEPTFRVVLTDSQNSTKSGRMLEILQGKKVNALPRKTPIKKEGDAAEASQTAAPVAEAIVEPVVEAETPAAEPASEAAPAEETPTA
jgi:ribosomal protein S16